MNTAFLVILFLLALAVAIFIVLLVLSLCKTSAKQAQEIPLLPPPDSPKNTIIIKTRATGPSFQVPITQSVAAEVRRRTPDHSSHFTDTCGCSHPSPNPQSEIRNPKSINPFYLAVPSKRRKP